jgi:hypothetical protein
LTSRSSPSKSLYTRPRPNGCTLRLDNSGHRNLLLIYVEWRGVTPCHAGCGLALHRLSPALSSASALGTGGRRDVFGIPRDSSRMKVTGDCGYSQEAIQAILDAPIPFTKEGAAQEEELTEVGRRASFLLRYPSSHDLRAHYRHPEITTHSHVRSFRLPV